MRRQVAPGDDVRFEVTVPFPKGITIAKKVIDIGNTGLSFYLDGNEGYMLPGTPLGECIVVDGHRKFKTAGEVVYSESIKNGEYHRIGVRFTADLRKQSLALYRQLGHHLRPSRYAAEEIAPLRLDVVLTDHSNMLVGVAVDFSRYGFAVGIPLSGARVVPRAIMEIVVRAGNRVVHTGSAVVAHVTTSSTVMLVGLELTDNLLNLKELECEKRCVILASQATALVEQMDHQKSLSPQFRAEIADLRSLLEQLKSLLDTVEHDLEETPEFSVLPNAFIDVIDREVVGSINASLKAIASLVGALGPKDHDRYRKHFQDALHPLLLESPFFARTFRKPLGYAGDFEMVNMILRNTDEGKTLFSRLLSRQGCNLPVARAHRNRIQYLTRAIVQQVRDCSLVGRTARITSIGCGPAREVVEYIGAETQDQDCEFTLVDFDPKALQHCQDILSEARIRSKSRVKVTIINKSVRELIKDARRGDSLPPQDLIYCGGLYDYLVFSTCCRLTAILHDSLAEGGRLIISNVSTENTYRVFMEYGLEWFLYHRTPEELSRMTSELPPNTQSYIDKDETGTNIFLTIVKNSTPCDFLDSTDVSDRRPSI